MWPLLDFIGEEEGEKSFVPEIMDDIRHDIDWEIKRAINEVVTNVFGEKSKDV